MTVRVGCDGLYGDGGGVKIPSQSSQPSRGVQRERLVSPVGSVGAFAYGKGRHRRPAPPKGARALLACRKCFCVTFAESNKGEDTFIYKEDYEKND